MFNSKEEFIMKKTIRRTLAAFLAAATLIITTVSASADSTPSWDWKAVYQSGAPSSVNKVYERGGIPAFKNGYKVKCTYFSGGNESLVTVTTPGKSTFRFTSTGTHKNVIPWYLSYGEEVTFYFSALESGTNTAANGDVLLNI